MPSVPPNWQTVVVVAGGAALPVLTLFTVFDLRYIFRLLWGIILRGRYFYKLSPQEQQKETRAVMGGRPLVFQSAVSSHDIDLFGHLSNSKYFKEADMARSNLILQGGLGQASYKISGSFVVAATSMRFRKELPYGKSYRIVSRVVGWDAVSIFTEQRFESESSKTGKLDLNGIMIARLQLTNKRKMVDVFRVLKVLDLPQSRIPPPDVTAWAISIQDANQRVKRESGDHEKSGTSAVSDEGIKPSPRLKAKM